MALWKAECIMDSSIGVQTVEVNANTIYGAKQLIQQIYNPKQISNLRRASSESCSGTESDSSVEGFGVICLLAILIWVFVTFTPIIMMMTLGVVGTKLTELVTGNSLEQSLDSNRSKITSAILIVAFFSGGFGLYFGEKIKRDYFTENAKPSQIKNNETSN